VVPEFHQLVQKLRLGVMVLSVERSGNLFLYTISQNQTGGKYEAAFHYGHGCIDDFYRLYFKKNVQLKNSIRGLLYFI